MPLPSTFVENTQLDLGSIGGKIFPDEVHHLMNLSLSPFPEDIQVVSMRATNKDRIEISGRTFASHRPCPKCGKSSGKVHSHYVRSISDLDWLGVHIEWRMICRKFFLPEPKLFWSGFL